MLLTNVKAPGPLVVKYCHIGHIKKQVKFMNISKERILQCNQSEPLADASERIVNLMNENEKHHANS